MVAIEFTVVSLGLEARGVEAQCRIIRGPLLDRVDLHVEVQAVSAADLVLPPPAEGGAEAAARVAAARARQTACYADHKARTNAEIDGE